MMMVARLPKAACAELIDFEQARIQRSMSSRQAAESFGDNPRRLGKGWDRLVGLNPS
jgi:hypothetical protein